MKITQITVNAGRTFNHPYESYSNLRPSVSLTATIQPGDDATACIKQLQADAEQLVEDHKNHLLASIEQLQQMSERQAQVARLSTTIARAQRELDEIRDQYPELKQLALPEEEPGGSLADRRGI